MAIEISIKGQKARKGERMTKGQGWRLAILKGRKRVLDVKGDVVTKIAKLLTGSFWINKIVPCLDKPV